ncbi:MAG: pseudouridine synthase [Candidatus Altiarchaeota archaeon]
MVEGKNTSTAVHRVQKLLSNLGYCSRRQAEELIRAGWVKVNGETVTVGGKASETDVITVGGKVVKGEDRVYLMFHKPTGCVTAVRDPRFKTVMDYLRIKERVFPIGRLDRDTSGILLLTNDGDFANSVMHPRYEVKKRYVVVLDKPVKQDVKRKIERGITLEDGKTAPAKSNILAENTLDITIHEGKNRIIRRMMKALGYNVKTLKRVSIGNLKLGTLKPGEYRNLTKNEITQIFK